MRIGLVDVDGHNFPNLALMKLATYHKQRGDEVEWAFPLLPYDRVYMAKVFTFTQDDITAYQTDDIVRGGTGYDLQSELPLDAERCYPDYSIYGITDTAYGYLTRGCPRGCKFCIVAAKEGKLSRKVAKLENFWRGQKYIKLLDPNLLACSEWKELMQQLIDSKAWVDFTQGLDIRLMTAEKADMIRQCKTKMLHFAWDNPEDELTFEKLKEYRKAFTLPKDKESVKAVKLLICIALILDTLGVFLPTEKELYAMYAAERITPANIKATGEFADKAVDKLIEKILKVSESTKKE